MCAVNDFSASLCLAWLGLAGIDEQGALLCCVDLHEKYEKCYHTTKVKWQNNWIKILLCPNRTGTSKSTKNKLLEATIDIGQHTLKIG